MSEKKVVASGNGGVAAGPGAGPPVGKRGQVFQEGWMVAASIGYYRGQEAVFPEHLGLKREEVPDYIRDLGHVSVLPARALMPFTRVESETRRGVYAWSFRFPLTSARYAPVKALPRLETFVAGCEGRFWTAVNEFGAHLGEFKEEMRPEFRRGAEKILRERAADVQDAEGFVDRYVQRMEGLFPRAEVIESRYWFRIDMFQMQIPNRSVVDELVAEGTLAGVGEQISQRLQSSLMRLDFFFRGLEIQLAARTLRLLNRVRRRAERSSAVGARMTQGLVEGADRLEVLNVPGFDAVRRVVEVLRGKIQGTSITRNVVRDIADELAAEAAWLTERVRKIDELPGFLKEELLGEVRSVLPEGDLAGLDEGEDGKDGEMDVQEDGRFQAPPAGVDPGTDPENIGMEAAGREKAA